jgi:hypothetical protein
MIPPATVARAAALLLERHGPVHASRIRQGVAQAAARWWAEDGDEAAFVSFCADHFLADEADRTRAFERIQHRLEQIEGRLHEIRRELHEPLDLDLGPIHRVDQLFADVDLMSHEAEDLFRSRVAFLALLNFPVHTLEERLRAGGAWTREEWARSRMMDRFDSRVPPALLQEVTRASNRAEVYISEYNIRMDRLETAGGARIFPDGLRLITHWGLRDALKAQYADGAAGTERQRLIQRVMERIIRQEIPEAVRDNPNLIWQPETNEVRPTGGGPAGPTQITREPDTRYAHLLAIFHAARAIDPYTPSAPSYIRRRFELDRQVPEAEMEGLIVSVLESPQVAAVARSIRSRLGRPLEPYDIWYSGFKSRGERSEFELDALVRGRYPTREAFQADLPRLLGQLGFTAEKARWLADRIVIDASRGAGHAMPAVRREDRVHLRTRVERGGMSYQGFNVAMHELGHNVEQVFSLHGIDHWFLASVPNTGCTEAFAFTFQARDLEMLGSPGAGEEAWRMRVLDQLWSAHEIAGVSLVDMRVWRWLYAHPDASAAELREAVLAIAREVWDRWFAPHLGAPGTDLLAVYSHMIVDGLYLPDYLLGTLIGFQIAQRLRTESFANEVERIARQGCLTPDAWIRGAVGAPLSAAALLEEADRALAALAAG